SSALSLVIARLPLLVNLRLVEVEIEQLLRGHVDHRAEGDKALKSIHRLSLEVVDVRGSFTLLPRFILEGVAGETHPIDCHGEVLFDGGVGLSTYVEEGVQNVSIPHLWRQEVPNARGPYPP